MHRLGVNFMGHDVLRVTAHLSHLERNLVLQQVIDKTPGMAERAARSHQGQL